MLRKFIILLALLGWLISTVGAQTGSGQLCVRAYEDRNGNAGRDPNEPPITRGISVSLADTNRVIIDSQLMDDSPNATTGTLCFQRLEAGQYTLRVLSADYTATAPSEFIAAVSDNGSPQVFDYGGQAVPIQASLPPENTGGDFELTPTEQQGVINRLVLATIGALFTIGVMTVIGAIVYVLFIRQGSAPEQPPQGATGQYQPLRPSTGRMAPVQPASDPFDFDPVPPSTGNTPPIDFDDPFGFDTPSTDSTDAPRRPAQAAPSDVGVDTDKPSIPKEETAPPRSSATMAPDQAEPTSQKADAEPWDDIDFEGSASESDDSASDDKSDD